MIGFPKLESGWLTTGQNRPNSFFISLGQLDRGVECNLDHGMNMMAK